jgi:hypothetical protein
MKNGIYKPRHMLMTTVIALFALGGTGASADIIDFVELTESGPYGESGHSSLVIAGTGFTLTITATKENSVTETTDDAFAYLDWNHAGLGVCGNVSDANVNVSYPGSGRNVCNPGSDDNVTTGETLSFVFDTDVVIERIWFNNTHDSSFTIDFSDGGDQIMINGVPVNAVGNGYATGNSYNDSIAGASAGNFLGAFNAGANVPFLIGFLNEQFYISGIEVRAAVPEPGTLALLGLGLVGIGAVRRRKKAQ